MKKSVDSMKAEIRRARSMWGAIGAARFKELRRLVNEHQVSVVSGDVMFLGRNWYITHSGLLRMAKRNGCAGITTVLQKDFCNAESNRWVFKATVYKSPRSKGFIGFGDAEPGNVSPMVRGAEMRVAETRAVNRALRKAYGIGLCSVEELGTLSGPPTSSVGSAQPHRFHAPGPSTNGHHPRLRDQLCLLIRQHNLDPALVKAYAADFCGTQTLKDAGRDLVESFISHIAKAAKEDRDALVCKLNSYAQPAEANP